jgi:hypothetical protein
LVEKVALKILNNEDRIFQAWGTVEIRDSQGDLIPIEEIEPTMYSYMSRGGPMIDGHSNRVVGKALKWENKSKLVNGKLIPGILLTGQVFKDYSVDDEVWQDIVSGRSTGMSFGGRCKSKEVKYIDGVPTNVLRGIEAFEFTIVRDGRVPVNEEAKYEYVNAVAKSTDFIKVLGFDSVIEKTVQKRGDKWVVVHCHGKDKGKVIGTHDTYESALRQHRAIEANKDKEENEMEKADDGRPPKEWWDNCIASAGKFADDPAKFCSWMYHHGQESGFNPQREAIGKSEEIDEEIMKAAVEKYTDIFKKRIWVKDPRVEGEGYWRNIRGVTEEPTGEAVPGAKKPVTQEPLADLKGKTIDFTGQGVVMGDTELSGKAKVVDYNEYDRIFQVQTDSGKTVPVEEDVIVALINEPKEPKMKKELLF